jgi:hypothetical protein
VLLRVVRMSGLVDKEMCLVSPGRNFGLEVTVAMSLFFKFLTSIIDPRAESLSFL